MHIHTYRYIYINIRTYCHVISHWEEGDKITTPRV